MMEKVYKVQKKTHIHEIDESLNKKKILQHF